MSRTFATRLLAVSTLFFLVFLIAGQAHAHRVTVFAWAEGDTIHSESTFSGGKKAQSSVIEVKDNATGKVLLSGKTDTKGLFSFAIPDSARQGRMDLLLALKAGQGHAGEWLITCPEYLGDAACAGVQEVTTPEETAVAAPLVADTKALEKAIEAALDKKLAPLSRKLAEMTDPGPTAKDVFAGLGYLVGLFGLAAYLKSRKG